MSDAPEILVPLDGSSLAERALPLALELSRRLGARLVLVSAPQVAGIDVAMYGETAVTMPEIPPPIPAADLLEGARRDALAYTGKLSQALAHTGVPMETLVRAGEPSEAILEVAEQRDVLLTCMATHGRGGIGRWAFGSVADRVMRLARTPVLVVRAGTAATNTVIRNVLVPLDGSSASEAVLPIATRVAQACDARVTLAHIVPAFDRIGWAADRDVPEIEKGYRRWLEGYLEGPVAGLRCADVEVVTERLEGESVAESLIEREGRGDIDLVAMSSHGRGGAARAALGSVTDRLIRSGGLPVLVAKRLPGSETRSKTPHRALL
jgi:nucleotide-binding universal stress UspA family protein